MTLSNSILKHSQKKKHPERSFDRSGYLVKIYSFKNSYFSSVSASKDSFAEEIIMSIAFLSLMS